ncbi:MAG: hypothetical protein JNM43_17815 [Planctomycetaceae bacterium]|nr:hypothetical protein [Planctomycetaceae bacterium]
MALLLITTALIAISVAYFNCVAFRVVQIVASRRDIGRSLRSPNGPPQLNLRLTSAIVSLAMFTGLAGNADAQQPGPWKVAERHGDAELYSEVAVDTRRIWAEMDQLTEELDKTVSVQPNGKPIQIVIYASQQSYLRKLATQIPQARNRKAIYYRNGDVSQVYVWNSRSLITDLRHEMTHVILHQHLPFLPLWIDEGLAEFFEETPAERTSSARISAVKWKARMGANPSLGDLESLPAAEEMDADAYRNSWAWCSFLLNESDESQKLLKDYLEQIHRGEAPGALSRYAQANNPGLLMRANSYFRKMTVRIISDSSRQ